MKETTSPIGQTGSAQSKIIHVRSTERIRQYLLSEFERPELTAGTRLPPVRQLAARLNVGVTTVHNVLREFARQGRIRTEVGNGTFLVSPQAKKSGVFQIALNMHLELDTTLDDWGMRIGAGILSGTLRARQSLHLMSVSKQIEESADLREALRAQIPHTDGVILFPFERTFGLDAEYERAGKLVLHVNAPSETATMNFVSADYYGASRLIGEAWRHTGRRRILLVIAPSLQDSVSSRLRYAGLVNGLGAGVGGSIALKVWETTDWGFEPVGYRVGQQIVADRDWMPDAVYCTGDHLALGVIRALREGGVNVPEQVSVIGGTGLPLLHSQCPQLTRTRQPCEKIGEELVAMLCQRIETTGAPAPGKYLPSPFVGGGTTRAEENVILKVGDASGS